MNSPKNRRFVRIDVQLIVEVDDPEALEVLARTRITEDGTLPDGERGRVEAVVTHDTAEALAYLVDPFDLVSELPGIELTQTSWSAEHVGRPSDSLREDPCGDDAEHDDAARADAFGFADDFDDRLDDGLDEDFDEDFDEIGDGVGGPPARIGIG
ncbi:hypothetical protein [Streptomyces sp. UH6]|uniref:hypothetical protein n=1 Tax=Streptomyces sp. UH6 TaxID=2748379 RepID=UPI0015D4C2DE|nr:hypothetical protein [Streptomyces sp. UH6]NYV76366.1 hypothetical protein [Streptomyces sp. UH6]